MTRRLWDLVALVVLLSVVLFTPTYLSVVRAASCSTQSGNGNGSTVVNLTVNAGDTINVTASDGIPNGVIIFVTLPGGSMVSDLDRISVTFGRSGAASVRFTPLPLAPAFTYSISINVCQPSGANIGPIPSFNDGRLNNWDAHETSAVYCMGDGSLHIYVPAEPKWRLVFTVSPAELASVPKNPAANTVIKSGNGATLLRLQNGSLQVDTPALEPSKGNYSFIFQDCPAPANQPTSGQPSGQSAPSFQLGDGRSFGQ